MERLRRSMASKTERRLRATDRKKHFLIGVAIALFLVTIPFYFYAYRLIPVEMAETKVFGITISAGSHVSLNYYAYYLFTKLVFLAAFTLWFYTCKYWWRLALLVPICMLIFQICGLVNTQINYIDEFDFWYSIPVVIPVAIVLVATSKWLNGYRRKLDLRDEIEFEIKDLQKD